jgi:hypothetical protein
MTALNKLNFTSITLKNDKNPILQRRKKLISAINLQLCSHSSSLKDEVFSVRKKSFVRDADGKKLKVDKEIAVKRWFFEKDSKWIVQCKYGTKVLLLNGKDNAVEVISINDVANVFRTLQRAVENGELDTAIETAMPKNSVTSA